MDENFKKVRAEMQIHKAARNITAYWKYWSTAVGNAFLFYLDESKVFNSEVKGRGEANFIQVKPDTEKKGRKEGCPPAFPVLYQVVLQGYVDSIDSGYPRALLAGQGLEGRQGSLF